MLNPITPQHLWEPLLNCLRDLAEDTRTVIKRRALVVELKQSHGIDILGSPDEHANDYLNRTMYLLREQGLVSTSARGEYRLTDKGLTQGLTSDTDFGTFETETVEDGGFLRPLWTGDQYIISLVASSAPCFGRYSAQAPQCTHECAVSGACHTATVFTLARVMDKCPPDSPTLLPPETENVLRKMPLAKEKECGKSGVMMQPGTSVYYHDEYGLISEEAAREFVSQNPGWVIE